MCLGFTVPYQKLPTGRIVLIWNPIQDNPVPGATLRKNHAARGDCDTLEFQIPQDLGQRLQFTTSDAPRLTLPEELIAGRADLGVKFLTAPLESVVLDQMREGH